MPAYRDLNFVTRNFSQYSPRVSGAAASCFHLSVGNHDVRAVPLSYGVNLHIRSNAVADAPSRLRSFVRLSPSGYWAMRVSGSTRTLRAAELLDWLCTVPSVPILQSPTVPRLPRRRRSDEGVTARRFGVEIEFNGINATDAMRALNATSLRVVSESGSSRSSWCLKYDGSVSGTGLELVSPPLSGDEGMEEVRIALRALRGVGARVNATCGLHVHHEIRDLAEAGIRRFVNAWAANQDLIDFLVSPSRRHGVPGASTYCRRWTERELSDFNTCTSRLNSPTRYKSVNVECFGRYGTVEVRQHQGTLDFAKVKAWIELGQSMVEACRTAPLAAAAQASTGLRDLFANLELHEDTAAYLLGRAIAFDAPATAVGYAPAAAPAVVVSSNEAPTYEFISAANARIGASATTTITPRF